MRGPLPRETSLHSAGAGPARPLALFLVAASGLVSAPRLALLAEDRLDAHGEVLRFAENGFQLLEVGRQFLRQLHFRLRGRRLTRRRHAGESRRAPLRTLLARVGRALLSTLYRLHGQLEHGGGRNDGRRGWLHLTDLLRAALATAALLGATALPHLFEDQLHQVGSRHLTPAATDTVLPGEALTGRSSGSLTLLLGEKVLQQRDDLLGRLVASLGRRLGLALLIPLPLLLLPLLLLPLASSLQ